MLIPMPATSSLSSSWRWHNHNALQRRQRYRRRTHTIGESNFTVRINAVSYVALVALLGHQRAPRTSCYWLPGPPSAIVGGSALSELQWELKVANGRNIYGAAKHTDTLSADWTGSHGVAIYHCIALFSQKNFCHADVLQLPQALCTLRSSHSIRRNEELLRCGAQQTVMVRTQQDLDTHSFQGTISLPGCCAHVSPQPYVWFVGPAIGLVTLHAIPLPPPALVEIEN